MQKSIEYEEGLKTKTELLHIKNFPLHMHQDDLQIVYVLDGVLDLELTHTHYYLPKGSIHVVHSEDVHAVRAITDENTVLMIDINTPYYENYFDDLDNIVFSVNIRNDVQGKKSILDLKKYIVSIAIEERDKQIGYQQRIREKTIALISTLIKHFRGFAVSTSQTLEHRTTYDTLQINRISNIIRYIYKNHAYKLSLSELAERENLSVYYLSHLFQRFVGISFRDFLSMARLEMSEYKLLSTKLSLSTIAQEAGFSSTQYYIENFIKWYGIHPKEFREVYSSKVIGMEAADYIHLPLSDVVKYLPDEISNEEVISNSKAFKNVCVRFDELRKAAVHDINTGMNTFTDYIWSVLGKTLQRIMSSSSVMQPPVAEKDLTSTASKLYVNHIEQLTCIDLMKSIINTGTIQPEHICLLDSAEKADGILTINGMKKPAYHFLQLLNTSYGGMIFSDTEYFITVNGSEYTIFAFNERKNAELHIDFDFSLNGSDYKITEKRLSSSRTCVTLWSQLNFMSIIDSEDMINIEKMSEPEISFQILTPSNHHLYTCSLQPLDIAVISVKAI